MSGPHLNSDSLRALVSALGARKQEVAVHADITPAAFSDLLSGRRWGTDPQLRARIADALGVHVRAITCHCDDPTEHRAGTP